MRYVFILIGTLTSYSLGAILGARVRGEPADPGLFDNLLLTISGSIGIFFMYRGQPPAEIAIWAMTLTAVTGFISSFTAKPSSLVAEWKPVSFSSRTSRLQTHGIWRKWRALAAEIADYQVRVLDALIYFTLLWPFVLFARSAGPPQGRDHSTTWKPRAGSGSDLESARRQF